MTICEAIKFGQPITRPPPGLQKHGVAISLRPRQRVALGREGEHVYVVNSGVLLLESLPQPSSRQVLDIYYAGDIVRSRLIPEVAGINLISASQAEVTRIGISRLESALEGDEVARHWFDCTVANQYPRRLIHVATIGTMTGEERVVSLLVELALRVGEQGYEGARTFDLPLSRTDMADYLALNADTLSRIMSRLRQSGVLGLAGRGRAYAPNFAELMKLTPLADTIVALHGHSRSATAQN